MTSKGVAIIATITPPVPVAMSCSCTFMPSPRGLLDNIIIKYGTLKTPQMLLEYWMEYSAGCSKFKLPEIRVICNYDVGPLVPSVRGFL